MATWRATTKQTGCFNGIRVSKGMSVEIITSSTCNQYNIFNTYRPQLQEAFLRKYGIDVVKGCGIATCYDFQKIG